MPAPIALQLYSVRDALSADFEATIRRVAEMGYLGVETAGVFGQGVPQAVALFRDLGLHVSSAHSPMPLGDAKNQVLDTMLALGCQYLVVPWLDPERFTTLADIEGVCDQINEAARIAQENGLTLAYHNHWFEFTSLAALGRRTPFDVMVEKLDASVVFELDVYWAKTGGSVPIDVIRQYRERMPLVHIKDGPATSRDDFMVAVGDGTLDYPAIIAAAGYTTEWLVVELDRCATDMLQAVEKSYHYLVGGGLARGTKAV